jgi:hypothetical protein
MEKDATFADTVRKTFEAYTEALSAVMQALERLPRQEGGAPHPARPASVSGTMIDALAESWKRTLDAFVPAGSPDEPWAERARRQAELVQQSVLDSLRAWQRLWQPPQRTP